MASHYIAIAKASFAAALLRPDPSTVGRDEIGRFHTLLDEAITKCTPSNVQKCKTWLSVNVINSTGRTAAFGKYLAALSTSYGKPVPAVSSQKANVPLPLTPAAEKAALGRKRLHILYLLNDVLHHAKYHTNNSSILSCVTTQLDPQLTTLFTLAVSVDGIKGSRRQKSVEDLLRIWEDHSYFSQGSIAKLHKILEDVGEAVLNGQEATPVVLQSNKELAFNIPAIHGDTSEPYHLLPAGTMVPNMSKNSTRPMKSQRIKPLQFVRGPAKDYVIDAVKDVVKDVGSTYGVDDEVLVIDVDEMGQLMNKDEKNGDMLAMETYYGWSLEFCERKKRRNTGNDDDNGIMDRGRRGSGSITGSRSPRKRRRYSSSGSRQDRSRSPRGLRSHDQSPSRSPPRDYRNGSRHVDARSNSQPRSPPNHYRQRSYSPTDAPRPSFLPQSLSHLAAFHHSNPPLQTPTGQIDNPIPTQPPGAPIPPPPSTYHHNFPIGPGGLPIPPPPPFHTGPWPPPPPNIPAGMTFNPSQYPNFSTVGFVPPPPPPQAAQTPYGSGGSLHGQGQGQGQGPGRGGGGGQRQWDGGNSERGGREQWHGRNGGRNGSGAQDHWNRSNTGRGGGANWRQQQDHSRRR